MYRLKVSPDNVLQIALEAGFSTHETFTRAFARRFGITPVRVPQRAARSIAQCADDVMGSRTFAGLHR